MYSKIQYRFNFFLRFVFILLGILAILIGIFVDGIKIFGIKTNKGAFNPIKVGIYKNMMDKRYRYRWKVKYEFFIEDQKYTGSKFFRGGPDSIDYKKEIGYLSFFPKINWLETDEPKGINFIILFIIGQFLFWFALRKKVLYSHDLSIVINGVYFSNTGLLPVKGLGPLAYLSFFFEEIKTGFKRVLSFKIIVLMIYLICVWYIILWAKDNTYYASFATILSTLTYAQAGVHGTLVDIIGGIIGKILFISFLLYPVIESKYETNYLIGKHDNNLSLFVLMSSLGAFILGIGISLILFNIMSSGFCREDSIIGLIMFFFCYKAQKNINNPIICFINSFEKGKPKNPNAAKMAMLGASIGFMIGFSVIWTSYTYFIDYFISSVVVVAGLSIIMVSFLLKNNSDSEAEL